MAKLTYSQVTSTDEFKEIECLRSLARHNEASAINHARREGEKAELKKWQSIVAEKDLALNEKEAIITELLTRLEKSK